VLAVFPLLSPAPPAVAAEAPPTHVISLRTQDLPPSAGMVLGAAILALRGGNELATDPVRFEGDTLARLFEGDFDYLGFEVPEISLFDFDAVAKGRFRFAAMVPFVDVLDRRAAVGLYVTYRVTKDGVPVVERATALPIHPRQPRVEMFVLPAGAVPRTLPATHADLYAFVLQNALPPPRANAALRAGEPCYVFVVAKDRLAKGASIEVALRTPDGVLGGLLAETRDVDFDGWHAAVLRARLAPTPAGAVPVPLTVEVTYRPGTPAAGAPAPVTGPQQVGRFEID
ncbi:MAG: hypothetical protein H6907_02585, partial [Hyphomicrobiales bacterium]|nr:hypothetical protein [Hyphomicrobiales bacterium]